VSVYVWISDPGVVGRVLSQMLYGAVVQYNFGGIEFNEMLADDDYEVMFDFENLEDYYE
jgi:hypothetical protein